MLIKIKDTRGRESWTLTLVVIAITLVCLAYGINIALQVAWVVGAAENEPELLSIGAFAGGITTLIAAWVGREWKQKSVDQEDRRHVA